MNPLAQFYTTMGPPNDPTLLSKSSVQANESNHAILSYLLASERDSKRNSEKQTVQSITIQPNLSTVNAQAASSLYQHLESDEIRLVSIHGRSSDNEDVRCSLKTIFLQDAPEYIALSYVWGSEEDAATIQVDGLEVKVTQSLKDALSHLSLLPISDEERPLLWVDALVINQSDISERNLQVSRMREIYASATLVLVWLGTGKLELQQLLWMIVNVPDIVPDDPENLDKENWENWSEMVNKYDPMASVFCMKNFVHFTMLPYFSRVWVVQEVAYANDAYVIYGGQWAPYQLFYDFIHKMLKRMTSTISLMSGTNAYSSAGGEYGRKFLGPQPGIALDGDFFSVGQWLNDCRRSCQDPRDKVYGFYGCFPEPIRNRITVDYCKPLAEVFIEMTKAIIEVSGSLDILDAIDDFRSDNAPLAALPSWCPDYSTPTQLTPWSLKPQGFPIDSNPSSFHFGQDGQVLHVRGVRLGTIKQTWCREQVVIPRGFYPDRVPFDRAQLNVTQCSEALNVLEIHILGLLMAHGGVKLDDQLATRLSYATESSTGKVWIRRTFTALNVDFLSRQWSGKALFTIDVPYNASGPQGSFDSKFFTQPVGFAKKSIRTGDALYVLEGGHNYMVLRQDDHHRKIVCSGYLYGQDVSFICTSKDLQNRVVEDILVT